MIPSLWSTAVTEVFAVHAFVVKAPVEIVTDRLGLTLYVPTYPCPVGITYLEVVVPPSVTGDGREVGFSWSFDFDTCDSWTLQLWARGRSFRMASMILGGIGSRVRRVDARRALSKVPSDDSASILSV